MTTTQMIIKDCKATIKELKGMRKDFDSITKRIQKEMKALVKFEKKETKDTKLRAKAEKKSSKKKSLKLGRRPVGRPRKSYNGQTLQSVMNPASEE